jgi:RES domain-containing protein
MIAPRWSHDPLSGAGAARNGGRWNKPGRPALYLSEHYTTAIAEYEQELGFRPGMLVAYNVSVTGLVDLTDPLILALLECDPIILSNPWKAVALIEKKEPPTWTLAEKLISQGYAGLRVPSVRAKGANIVLWRWNDDQSRKVETLDPLGDLPLNAASWTK